MQFQSHEWTAHAEERAVHARAMDKVDDKMDFVMLRHLSEKIFRLPLFMSEARPSMRTRTGSA